MQIVDFKHWTLELALSQTIQLVCKLRNATLGIIALKKLEVKNRYKHILFDAR